MAMNTIGPTRTTNSKTTDDPDQAESFQNGEIGGASS